MLRRFIPAMVLMGAASGSTLAADSLSYNYLEGSYGTASTSGYQDSNSWNVGGAWAIADKYHLFGGFTEFDVGPGASLHLWKVGVGANLALGKRSDLIVRGALASARASIAGLGAGTENGYSAAVGVRGLLTPQFELEGGVEYLKLQDVGDVTDTYGVFRYHFSDQLAGTVGVDMDNGSPTTTTWSVGLRYSFR